MARRRARSRMVRGKPDLLWVASAGEIAVTTGNSSYDPILQPGDWSGTVFEKKATLLRLVLTCMTSTRDESGHPHSQNCCITMGDASEGTGSSTLDVSSPTDWPDFFLQHDRVLRIFRLEWDGVVGGTVDHPVQFSQLPDPIMSIKCPRLLNPDDSVRLWVGGSYTPVSTETALVTWFCRSLVRVGVR